MAYKGRSERGIFGTVYHYDEHGRKTGRSEPGLLGGYINYDAKGNKVGRSDPGLFGGLDHYDNKRKKIGHSDPGICGGFTHRDATGKKIGSSAPGFFSTYRHSDDQGCYIATCVYGSYDCPQVWTLRRFRDHTLAATLPGRAFIRTYYFISPKLVNWFGHKKWFKYLWKGALDGMVRRLNMNGVESTPYNDREW